MINKEEVFETNEMIEKENQARKNVEKFMEQQEKNRLQFERDIHDKSKNIKYNIIYNYYYS